MTSNTETYLIVFVALTGAAVLLQALILLAIFIALRKAAKTMIEAFTDVKASVLPMVHSTRDLIQRITPQVITISTDLANLTEKIKRETSNSSVSVSEIMERVSQQVKRLDTMITSGLNTVEKASNAVETTVSAPVRQVNGVVAAIKAVINTYRYAPVQKSNRNSTDKESGW